MTPRDQGLRMPADWAIHGRYWLAWPQQAGLWSQNLAPAREACIDLAHMVSDLGPVTVLANPEELVEVSLHIGAGSDIRTMILPHDDCCMRAIGPGFLVDEQGRAAAGLQWDRRGQRLRDISRDLLDHLGLRGFSGPSGLRGCMVDVDGEGTALAAEAWFRGMDPAEAERMLSGLFGVDRVIWLKTGLEGDITGGHIPNMSRFLQPGLVIATTENDVGDGNYDLLRENIDRLKAARDAKGRQLSIVEAPQPKRRTRPDGSRIALSYSNCFVAPNMIVLPSFDSKRDQMVLDAVSAAMPDATVLQLPTLDIAFGGGGLASIILPQPEAHA